MIPYWKKLQFYITSYLCSFHFWYFSFYIRAQSALAGLQRMEAAQDGLESGYDMQVYLWVMTCKYAGSDADNVDDDDLTVKTKIIPNYVWK